MCTHSIKVLCENFIVINTFCSISPITESTNENLYSCTVIYLEILTHVKYMGIYVSERNQLFCLVSSSIFPNSEEMRLTYSS